MTRLRRRRPAGDRGNATVELVVWAPLLILVLFTLYWVSRYVTAEFAMSEVAANAARAASLSVDPASAQATAEAAAYDSIAEQDLRCVDLQVAVDVSGFGTPLGQPAEVTVQISCTVDNSDLVWPGIPGNPTLTGDAVSPLDAYRSR